MYVHVLPSGDWNTLYPDSFELLSTHETVYVVPEAETLTVGAHVTVWPVMVFELVDPPAFDVEM